MTDPAQGSRLRERLELWIEETLGQEQPIEGIDAELLRELDASQAVAPVQADLYTLWSAMTGLVQEVKLQGRAFNQLNESLARVTELPTVVTRALDVLSRAVEAARGSSEAATRLAGAQRSEIEREAKRRALGQMLDLLLDLRDRLEHGHSVAGDHLQRAEALIDRPVSPEAFVEAACELLESARAHEKGYLLGLRRLDEVLRDQGVTEIDCVPGDAFDPRTMHVVDVETTAEQPEATVVEIVRQGYELEGEIERYCDVIVTRRPPTKQDAGRDT